MSVVTTVLHTHNKVRGGIVARTNRGSNNVAAISSIPHYVSSAICINECNTIYVILGRYDMLFEMIVAYLSISRRSRNISPKVRNICRQVGNVRNT